MARHRKKGLSGNRQAQKAGRSYTIVEEKAITSPKGTPRIKKIRKTIEGPNPNDRRNIRKAKGSRVQRRANTKA